MIVNMGGIISNRRKIHIILKDHNQTKSLDFDFKAQEKLGAWQISLQRPFYCIQITCSKTKAHVTILRVNAKRNSVKKRC